MSVELKHSDDAIILIAQSTATATSGSEPTVVLRPGDSWRHFSYDQLRAVGEGRHSLRCRCERRFLGWDEPLLPAAVRSVASLSTDDDSLDLRDFSCVLPTSFAAYRFETLLRQHAVEAGIKIVSPKVLTLGQLPEILYTPSRKLAIELEQTLAWSAVLSATNPDDLKPLVPTLPSSDEIDSWMELAATIRSLHEDLASNNLSFSDVARQTQSPSDSRRWNLLAQLLDAYLETLSQADLADPHDQRRRALQGERCGTAQTIVLIGTSDLSHLQLSILRSADACLVSLVAAPESESQRFDELGGLRTSQWIDHCLRIEDDQLIPAGDIADQAVATAEILADYAGRHSADQVTIGVTDESQVGPVQMEMRGCGVETFRHLGWSVRATAVGRLLDLTATYLKSGSWQSLATLVRHADVYDFLSQIAELKTAQGEAIDGDTWLTQLDQLLANHFPIHLNQTIPKKARDTYPQAIAVAEAIENGLSVFREKPQRLGQWCEQVHLWLQTIYRADALRESPHARTAMAFDSVARLLQRFSEVSRNLDIVVDGGDAMQMIADRTGDLRVVEPMQTDEVEILGWLDLPLDDAESLVVVGLNHPYVPAAVTNDPFLPGTLRTQLRMADNDRRFARDIYNMHLLLQTRSEVRFVVGRFAANGSPTPPSRLLAAASALDVARRIRRLIGSSRPRQPIHHRWDDLTGKASIPIPTLPLPNDESPVKAMSVTAFRDYLACPYRFYLRHVLKLRPLEDGLSELAANQFGDLIHGAVERFGQSDDRDETDREKIEQLLIGYLHQYADEHYGQSASAAVILQIRQAERRLAVVAAEQANRIASGWRIKASEASVDEGAFIQVENFKVTLRGRLDRIDFHKDSGQWAILDYKTHGHKPEKKHLKKLDDGFKWIDLQLPLYRLMIPHLGIKAPPEQVQLGYFNISDKDAETKINIAEFDEALMNQAEELIYDCVRRIRDCDFAPTADAIEYDDYAMILQTGITRPSE